MGGEHIVELRFPVEELRDEFIRWMSKVGERAFANARQAKTGTPISMTYCSASDLPGVVIVVEFDEVYRGNES